MASLRDSSNFLLILSGRSFRFPFKSKPFLFKCISVLSCTLLLTDIGWVLLDSKSLFNNKSFRAGWNKISSKWYLFYRNIELDSNQYLPEELRLMFLLSLVKFWGLEVREQSLRIWYHLFLLHIVYPFLSSVIISDLNQRWIWIIIIKINDNKTSLSCSFFNFSFW